MSDKQCNFCGQTQFITKNVEYIYRYQGYYVVFRNVPAEVCLHCGMRYYQGQIILNLEKRFFEIYKKHRQPTETVSVPVETL